ncbi:MAG: cytosolic protein [Ignavibacteriae bacterium]|nr:cytosolic protein [Ignavibacteriota bacterium]
MDCKIENNLKRCNCTYNPCSRKGNCCDCITYHIRSRELPACFFPKDAERTYDRSYEHFAILVSSGRI